MDATLPGKEITNAIFQPKPALAPLANSCSIWSLTLAASLLFWSCSTARPPTNRVAQAEISVRAAEEARAADLAPVDLQNARDKLAKARQALTAEKYDDARRLAERAQVDAQLAEAKAEAATVRRAADQILRRADAPPSQAELESRKPLTIRPEKE